MCLTYSTLLTMLCCMQSSSITSMCLTYSTLLTMLCCMQSSSITSMCLTYSTLLTMLCCMQSSSITSMCLTCSTLLTMLCCMQSSSILYTQKHAIVSSILTYAKCQGLTPVQVFTVAVHADRTPDVVQYSLSLHQLQSSACFNGWHCKHIITSRSAVLPESALASVQCLFQRLAL